MDSKEHLSHSTKALAAVAAVLADALSQSDEAFAANLESSMDRIYHKLRDSENDPSEALQVLKYMRELLRR